jgi:hypothetical protein
MSTERHLSDSLVIPLFILNELPHEVQQEFIGEINSIKRRFPSAVGMIIVGYKRGKKVQYWNAGEFLAEIGDENRAEDPLFYKTIRGAGKRCKILSENFPNRIWTIAYWVCGDVYPETTPIAKYMKMLRQFPGTVQQ